MAKLTMYQFVRRVLKNKGRAVGEWNGDGQTSDYEINRYWGCMYTMRTVVNTAVGIFESCKESKLNVLTSREKHFL